MFSMNPFIRIFSDCRIRSTTFQVDCRTMDYHLVGKCIPVSEHWVNEKGFCYL